MEDEIDLRLDLKRQRDILQLKTECGVSAKVLYVTLRAGQQVVEAQNGEAFGKKPVAHVRSHKSGGAGYHGVTHFFLTI